jgi:Mlc titration factor MtfA (ptsG expression regulator)
MRVVPRLEIPFLAIRALLIAAAGIAILLMTGRTAALPLLLLLLAAYLALALRRPLRRRRAARAPFPGERREFLLACSPFFRGLDPGGRERFERDVRLFLAETRIAGTGGAPVSWQAKLLVAAGAAAMLHGRPDWEPPLRDGVTVYPGFAFDRNYRAGKGNIAGQAPAGGPLLVAEKSLLEGFAGERDGFNVIIHELAHYFDLEARTGGWRLVVAGSGETPWSEAIDREYAAHDFAASVLSDYASQNEAEFFACACEMFFEDPRRLAGAHPGLFALLGEFFNQDTRATLGGSVP